MVCYFLQDQENRHDNDQLTNLNTDIKAEKSKDKNTGEARNQTAPRQSQARATDQRRKRQPPVTGEICRIYGEYSQSRSRQSQCNQRLNNIARHNDETNAGHAKRQSVGCGKQADLKHQMPPGQTVSQQPDDKQNMVEPGGTIWMMPERMYLTITSQMVGTISVDSKTRTDTAPHQEVCINQVTTATRLPDQQPN